MTAAWTTFAIIAFLLPGVGFFIGYWAQERYAREIVRSTAVGEVGMAIFAAMVLHLIAAGFLWLFRFDLAVFFAPTMVSYTTEWQWLLAEHVVAKVIAATVYLLIVSVAGFLLGLLIGWMVMFGPFRRLATHKWAYDLIKEKNRGVVTVYVMTTTTVNDRVLMYSGHLEEFYLDPNGWFTYIVLRDCSSYYMTFDGDTLKSGNRRTLFRVAQTNARRWEHLAIPGENIANVLFDPLGEILETQEDTKALDSALSEAEAATGG